jgi:hypothetical protein
MKHVSLAAEDKAANPILWANGGLSRVCVKNEHSPGNSQGPFHQARQIHDLGKRRLFHLSGLGRGVASPGTEPIDH